MLDTDRLTISQSAQADSARQSEKAITVASMETMSLPDDCSKFPFADETTEETCSEYVGEKAGGHVQSSTFLTSSDSSVESGDSEIEQRQSTEATHTSTMSEHPADDTLDTLDQRTERSVDGVSERTAADALQSDAASTAHSVSKYLVTDVKNLSDNQTGDLFNLCMYM